MHRIFVTLIALAAGAAFAQAPDGGVSPISDEGALTGTPQKSPPPVEPVADGGTPSGDDSPAPSDRPSEDDLFGGGQTPSPEGAPNERPSEDDLFGGSSEPPASSAAQQMTQEVEKNEPASQDEKGLGGVVLDRFSTGNAVENPLQIGGLFYQRMTATARAGSSFKGTTLSVPTLVDAYFDARPNDRLRAMIVGRLRYDATFDETALQSQLMGQPRANPSVSLDQMWLSFDIERQLFITAGRQHVRWGTGRFWNPTDYLHVVRRDPLALFDERLGTNMIKLQLPFESTGANLYAMGVLDSASGQLGTLGSIGGAARAEAVFGETEVGVDAFIQNGTRPKYGADISSALGPFDVYGEISLRAGPVHRYEPAASSPPGFTLFELHQVADYGLSGTVGANYTFAYRENDTATIGAEYFYNPYGYDDPAVYPFLLLNGAFQPFYVGKQYAAVYALLPGPGDWDRTSFVLSNLANLSDHSYVSRLDFTVRVLSYLTVEANASLFYGNPEGEFRLRLTLPGAAIGAPTDFTIPEQNFSLGLGLRLSM
ncbi:MAG: hypothetical protein IRZ16_17905 [Myxococcaceae bacterium]|nr:hypothetical protein [Myxococcaceae bacterium]